MRFRSTFFAMTTLTTAALIASTSYSQNTFAPTQYAQTDLVANEGGQAAVTDPNLVNAWGLSRSSNGDWWVADTGTGLSTLYDGTSGKITPLVVTIPAADPTALPHGLPTGTIFNGGGGFNVAQGKSAIFLFCSLDGTISGWNPGAAPTTAIIAVKEQGSSFTGLTMSRAKNQGVEETFIYVADFGKKRIAVYDSRFNHATSIEAKINSVPLPEGYVPYNVQNLGGNIYVAFAKKGANGRDEAGTGLGDVAVFTSAGDLIQVFPRGPYFNAPWGMAIAPGDFGAYSHDVLVGNFGNGTIMAFDPITGAYKGKMQNAENTDLVIPGLWAMSIGNGTELGGPATSVFFAAGPDGEQGGLFGSLSALANPSGNDQ